MHIFIRQNNGNGYELQMSQNDSIDSMFFELSQVYNQKPENYAFFYRGKPLNNFKSSFLDLKISQNSIIHIQKKEQLVASTNSSRQIVFNLSIFSFQNQTIVVNLTSNDTVLKIKHKIFQLLKIHPKEQTLVFQGVKLQDDQHLKQTDLKNNSLISLIVHIKQTLVDQNQYQFLQSPQLLQSITSLHHKASQNSKTSLFRSDSINKKNAQTQRIEVQIKQKKISFIDLGASVESNGGFHPNKCGKNNGKQFMQMYQLNGLQEEAEYCFQNQENNLDRNQSAYKQLQAFLNENQSLNILQTQSKSERKTFSKISKDDKFQLSINPELVKIDQDYQDLKDFSDKLKYT